MTNHVLPRKNPLPLGRGCLTEEIDENKIEAKFEDGVLKISIEEIRPLGKHKIVLVGD